MSADTVRGKGTLHMVRVPKIDATLRCPEIFERHVASLILHVVATHMMTTIMAVASQHCYDKNQLMC